MKDGCENAVELEELFLGKYSISPGVKEEFL